MDEENKKINLESFFKRVDSVERVANSALSNTNSNLGIVNNQKSLIESLSISIEAMETKIRDIANYIIVERKLESDREEDKRLEAEDAEQKRRMTERAAAMGETGPQKESVKPAEPQGGGGGFLGGLIKTLGGLMVGGFALKYIAPVILPKLLLLAKSKLLPVIGTGLKSAVTTSFKFIGGALSKGFLPLVGLTLIGKAFEPIVKGIKGTFDGVSNFFSGKIDSIFKEGGGDVGGTGVSSGSNMGATNLTVATDMTDTLKKEGLVEDQKDDGNEIKLDKEEGDDEIKLAKEEGDDEIKLAKEESGGDVEKKNSVDNAIEKGKDIVGKVIQKGKDAVLGSPVKAGTLDEYNEFIAQEKLDQEKSNLDNKGLTAEDGKLKIKVIANREKVELSGASKKLIGDDTDFLEAVKEVSQKRGMNQAEFLGAIASESGLDPKAVNKDTGATGLIQFLPEVAESLGTTTDKILEMSRAEQVKLIDKYFDMNKLPDNPTAGQLKTNILMPAYTDKGDDFELMTKNKQFTDGEAGNPNTYSQNKGLDYNEDGFITVGEAGESIIKKMREFGIKDMSDVLVEPTKKRGVDLSLSKNLETTDKLTNAVSYQSGVENKNQNGNVLVQSKPAQTTIASVKKTQSSVSFIKTMKNQYLSINETELPPEVARMIS